MTLMADDLGDCGEMEVSLQFVSFVLVQSYKDDTCYTITLCDSVRA